MFRKLPLLLFLCVFLSSCQTELVSPKGSDFFTNHTWLQLFGWVFFPRIMFWIFSSMTGGLGFFLGVLFIPRIMVAYWATTYYWDTNPGLCVVSWFIAFVGESTEKGELAS